MYNNEKTIEGTLEHVVSQTQSFSEVIIVDNGSDDQSRALVQAFCERYPYMRLLLCSEKGVSSARNMGIEAAQNPYLSFLDADDIVKPTYVSEIEQAILQNPKGNLFHFNFYHQFKNGIINPNLYFLNEQPMYLGKDFMNETRSRFSFEAKHMVWSFVFQKSFLDQHQLRFDSDVKLFEDILFLQQVWECQPTIVIVDRVLLTYRYTGDSMTNSMHQEMVEQALSQLVIKSKPDQYRYFKQFTSRLLNQKRYVRFWDSVLLEEKMSSLGYALTYWYYRVAWIKMRILKKCKIKK